MLTKDSFLKILMDPTRQVNLKEQFWSKCKRVNRKTSKTNIIRNSREFSQQNSRLVVKI